MGAVKMRFRWRGTEVRISFLFAIIAMSLPSSKAGHSAYRQLKSSRSNRLLSREKAIIPESRRSRQSSSTPPDPSTEKSKTTEILETGESNINPIYYKDLPSKPVFNKNRLAQDILKLRNEVFEVEGRREETTRKL